LARVTVKRYQRLRSQSQPKIVAALQTNPTLALCR
jgi:hypothetical protein